MRDAANPVEPWFFIPHNSRRIVKSSTIRAQFPQTHSRKWVVFNARSCGEQAFPVWGGRGPGFKSRRPDQLNQSGSKNQAPFRQLHRRSTFAQPSHFSRLWYAFRSFFGLLTLKPPFSLYSRTSTVRTNLFAFSQNSCSLPRASIRFAISVCAGVWLRQAAFDSASQ